MTENWRLKLEESSFEDLSNDEQVQLIHAMEEDLDLRKKVISDLRFTSVLKETLRTEENPNYHDELNQKWSKERVFDQMQTLGMDPKPLKQAEVRTFKLNKALIAILGIIILAVILKLLIPSNEPASESSNQKVSFISVKTNLEGELLLERNGKVRLVKSLNLMDGDILSTQKNNFGEITLENGVFLEFGRNAKVVWSIVDGIKEVKLLSGSVTATFAKKKEQKDKLVLSAAYVKTGGDGFKIHANQQDKRSQIEVIEGRVQLHSLINPKSEMARSGEVWNFHATGKIKSTSDLRDVLDQDLVAWWSMDDGQGKTVNDFSGSGFQGSLAGHVKLAEGLRGQALKISEINRKNLVIPHSPELNIHPVRGITVMSWIKTTRMDTATILDKRFGEREGGKYFGYQMVLVNGTLRFQMDDGRTLMFNSSEFVADGNWHHICVSVTRGDTEKGTFYVDGKEVGSFDSREIGNTDSPGSLNIGGHVDLDNHAFVGYIDEVRVYNRGLNEAEIQSVMNRTD